jgi:hypothetical protein
LKQQDENPKGLPMHLAYVTTTDRGATDRLLSAVAERLLAKGARLAGVVQTNTECADSSKCDMDLRVLPDGETIRISQSLGSQSRGCRLDPAALEQAVGYVTASLADEALAVDVPVLVGVNGLNRDKFVDFTDGAAQSLEPRLDAIEAWFDSVANLRPAAE